MGSDKKNINDLISLIERNKVSQGQMAWYNQQQDTGEASDAVEEEEEEGGEEDYSDVRLLVFATEGPFTESLFPMLDQHEVQYAVTDVPEEAIDIAMNNPHIRHVLLDLDRPTNPAASVNIFSELKMVNPNIIVHYSTKNPMAMESRSIQTKGAKLLQKPVLRKTVDQFVSEYFKL
ncbi:MAG: hypothetical protein LBH93_05560 [Chitinispirillales bacterium]|nr:hypothetical protein [Chitinispirillales bacterium]